MIGSVGSLFFRGYGESPERGLCERVVNGAALVGVVADGTVFQIFLNEQNLGSAAFEAHDAGSPELAAVKPDVVRANARGQAALVKELRAPLVDFEPQLALLRVPVEIEIARELLRAGGLFTNGRRLRSLRAGAEAVRTNAQKTEHKASTRNFQHVQRLRMEGTFYIKRRLAREKILSAILSRTCGYLYRAKTSHFDRAVFEHRAARLGIYVRAVCREV